MKMTKLIKVMMMVMAMCTKGEMDHQRDQRDSTRLATNYNTDAARTGYSQCCLILVTYHHKYIAYTIQVVRMCPVLNHQRLPPLNQFSAVWF